MTNDLVYDLQLLGHLATTAQLASLGHGRRRIENAVAGGRIVRVCRNWVATTQASRTAVIAVLQRGKLTGPAALASYGVWDALDRQIHVQLRHNRHGSPITPLTPISAFAQESYLRVGVRRHWSEEQHPLGIGAAWRVSVLDALIRVAQDCAAEHFAACVESALHTGRLSRAGIPVLFASLPKGLQALRGEIDPLSESGLETLARLRLSQFVQSIRSQVHIPGINRGGRAGRVDLLLDEWLVIELDGDEFHDPVADRARTAALVRQGYRVHRFGYQQIVYEWVDVEATVRELLRYPSR
jgi:very-short-patch-repair endonuclease